MPTSDSPIPIGQDLSVRLKSAEAPGRSVHVGELLYHDSDPGDHVIAVIVRELEGNGSAGIDSAIKRVALALRDDLGGIGSRLDDALQLQAVSSETTDKV